MDKAKLEELLLRVVQLSLDIDGLDTELIEHSEIEAFNTASALISLAEDNINRAKERLLNFEKESK